MKERISSFLSAERISSAEFADKIGVQRSSISHILNGRNNPSALFIQKMLQTYPALNPRWLLIGEGNMKEDSIETVSSFSNPGDPVIVSGSTGEHSLFPPDNPNSVSATQPLEILPNETKNPLEHANTARPEAEPQLLQPSPAAGRIEISNQQTVVQVLMLYADKTFTVYRPA